MIELLKGFPDNVVAVGCKGRVTKDDYDKVLVPTVDEQMTIWQKRQSPPQDANTG